VQLCDVYGRPYTESDQDCSPSLLCFCKSVQVPHIVQQIAALLQQFGWACLERLPYSPDLALSDSSFWPSEKVSWWSQMQKSRKLSQSGSAYKAQNSVLKATFTDNKL
jgi:hypothetical protein